MSKPWSPGKTVQYLGELTNFYSLTAKTLEGAPFDFSTLKGKVVLITNVACQCGYTKGNYEQLVALDNKYNGKLVIMAFPSNEFGAQEPQPAKEIREFVTGFGVKFPMMEKTFVNGPHTHPVYKCLKAATGTPDRDIAWNFETKFLVSPDGKRVEQYSKAFDVSSLVPHIDRLLGEFGKL